MKMMIDQRITNRSGAMKASIVAIFVALASAIAAPVDAADAVAEWNSIKAPAAPELKKVTASAKDTALIVMDMQTNSCNAERRPRCLETVAPVADLLKRARAKGMLVIHTITTSGTREMLLKELAPEASEPHVQAGVDKFFKTNLEEQLKAKGITNVILVGTAAEGAVLGTATGAALRGMKVIVPVDGMSSADAYAEQYTAVYLTKSPGTATAATLTRAGTIDIN
jgi:nicotinamidase-related amidase